MPSTTIKSYSTKRTIAANTSKSYCCTGWFNNNDLEVVPRVARILKARWDAAAGMQVMELELEGGDFKVTSAEYGCEDEDGGGVDPGARIEQWGHHIVKLSNDLPWCSCGAWQDCMFPCRHGCAVYRKWKEVDFNYVLANLVDEKYTFGNVKNMLRKNVFPVSLDGIQYDGVTKPPLVAKRQSGRPRT